MTMPGGWEWLIIVGVVLLLFGAKRLPEMARSVGQSARVFKGEMKGLKSDDEARKATEQPQADKPATPPAPPTALPQAADTSQHVQTAQQTTQNGQGITKAAHPGPGSGAQ
jgi:sec-independent protein translocase protein TatA